jgi:ABC-type multidrug transport system permease subunit
MAKIKSIIKKNLKLILSSKKSYIYIFIIPALLFFFLGNLFYNTNDFNIKIGFVFENNDNLLKDYKTKFEEKKFIVKEFKEKKDCLNQIEKDLLHMCISLKNNTGTNKSKIKLEIVVDNSKQNLVEIGKNIFTQIFKKETESLKKDYLISISNTLKLIKNKTKKQENLLSEISKDLISTKEAFSNGPIKDKISENYNKSLALKEKVDSYILKREFSLNIIRNKISRLDKNSTDRKAIEKELNAYDKYLFEYINLVEELKKFNSNSNFSTEFDTIFKDIDSENSNINENIKKLSDLVELINTNSNEISEEKLDILSNPLEINIKNLYTNEKESDFKQLSSSIHILLGIIICLVTILFSSNITYSERQNPAYLRNIMSNGSGLKFVLGNNISLLLILYLQIFVILFIFNIFYLGIWSANFFFLLLSLVFVIYIFILIGQIIGLVSNNLTSNFMLNFFTIFVLFIFSGSLIPLEVFSEGVINFITNSNPLVISLEIIKKSLFESLNFELFLTLILSLIEWIIFLFLLAIFLQSYDMKKLAFYLSHKLFLKIEKYLDRFPSLKKKFVEVSELLEEKLKI